MGREKRKEIAKRLLAVGMCGAFATAVVAVLAWAVLPVFFGDPMEDIVAQTPTMVFYDADDIVQRYAATYDYEWRLPVAKEQVSRHFIDAILSVEDHDFYEHGGVCYRAILRAAIGNIIGGRRISGASTITMQLAYLPQAGRRKTLWRKFIQCQKARRLEQLYSKDRILMEYINRIPCGGKIYGVQAASLYYFDKPASRLTIEEAALIAGLPQYPNHYRPDRHPERARRRQLMVLWSMERNGLLKPGEAKALNQNYLHFHNFKEPPFYKSNSMYPLYFARAAMEANGRHDVRTYLSAYHQDIILNYLKTAAAKLDDVKDAAAVLLDARNGHVISMVGTLDFNDREDGQVNAAIRRRSAGSTLKPFIYAEAIEGGLLAEATVMRDEPVRYGNYLPANYSGSFAGDVTAAEALSRSLNMPVIKLLSQLGVDRVAKRFNEMSLIDGQIKEVARTKGLTIALGTSGVSPLRLATAYTALANGGVMSEYAFTVNKEGRQTTMFTRGTADMVSLMLRKHPLVGSTVDVAWKTGTSNGLFDAWCVAYTPDYVLAVWFGNKNGRPSSSLVGGKVAAPVAARIMSSLYAKREPPQWPQPDDTLIHARLCRHSGMLPSSDCKDYTYGWVLKDFALRRCSRCGVNAIPKINILSPRPTVYIAEEKHGVRLYLSANMKVLWYLDGVYLDDYSDEDGILVRPGVHSVYAIAPDGNAESASVTFTVAKSAFVTSNAAKY